MNKELTKWFKDNCKDVGHVNYGEVQKIIEKHEAEKETGNRKLNALMGNK